MHKVLKDHRFTVSSGARKPPFLARLIKIPDANLIVEANDHGLLQHQVFEKICKVATGVFEVVVFMNHERREAVQCYYELRSFREVNFGFDEFSIIFVGEENSK